MRSGSRRNGTYTAFREVGRRIRTVQLMRNLSDAPLRRRVSMTPRPSPRSCAGSRHLTEPWHRGVPAPRPRADPGDRVEVTAIGRPARRRTPG
ncbi:Tn3 family transposase [Streptomyces fodineus]|uniref:Tn3 family transposase n=1 Tax=Streptomyces fodineus TaxID=1904616 RepID=UPI00131D17CB